MSLETLRQILGWCSVINMGLLIVWGLMMVAARDWIYKVHSKWFVISKEQFGAIHYTGIMFFKTATFMFFVIPYIALRIIG